MADILSPAISCVILSRSFYVYVLQHFRVVIFSKMSMNKPRDEVMKSVYCFIISSDSDLFFCFFFPRNDNTKP